MWCVSAARLGTQQRCVVRERCAPMGAASLGARARATGAVVLYEYYGATSMVLLGCLAMVKQCCEMYGLNNYR